eukprot:1160709-Pelagomonas_calceolata.AAC.4
MSFLRVLPSIRSVGVPQVLGATTGTQQKCMGRCPAPGKEAKLKIYPSHKCSTGTPHNHPQATLVSSKKHSLGKQLVRIPPCTMRNLWETRAWWALQVGAGCWSFLLSSTLAGTGCLACQHTEARSLKLYASSPRLATGSTVRLPKSRSKRSIVSNPRLR